jgi:hypothetical protein
VEGSGRGVIEILSGVFLEELARTSDWSVSRTEHVPRTGQEREF